MDTTSACKEFLLNMYNNQEGSNKYVVFVHTLFPLKLWTLLHNYPFIPKNFRPKNASA